jgi:hypothetical protein
VDKNPINKEQERTWKKNAFKERPIFTRGYDITRRTLCTSTRIFSPYIFSDISSVSLFVDRC